MQVHIMPNTFFSSSIAILFIHLKSLRLPFIEPIKEEEIVNTHQFLVWDLYHSSAFWIMHQNSNRICCSDISLQAKIVSDESILLLAVYGI